MTEPDRLHPFSAHQEEVIRAIALGRIEKFDSPGRWCAYVEHDEIVVRDLDGGWMARVPMP